MIDNIFETAFLFAIISLIGWWMCSEEGDGPAWVRQLSILALRASIIVLVTTTIIIIWSN